MKLKQRIILFNLIAFNVIVIISMTLYFLYTVNIVKQNINTQNQLKADLMAAKIDENLSKEMSIANQSIHTIEYFKITDYEMATDFLVNLNCQRPNNDFAIFLENGTFANSQKWQPSEEYKPRERLWYTTAKASDKIIVTNPYISVSSKAKKVSFAICKSFKIQDAEAVFVTEIGLDVIENMLKEFTQDSESYAFLIGNDSLILLHPNKEYQLSVDKLTKLSDVPSGDKFAEAVKSQHLNKKDKNFIQTTNYQGKESLFYFAKTQTADWTIAFSVPYSELNEPINKIRIQTIILALLLMISVLVISLILAKKLATPLEKMVARLRNISRSSNAINTEIISTSNYELKEIATSFNNILEKIGNTQEQSNKININSNANKVVERIKSIQEVNEENCYLLYIDIDKFKTINKLFGYYAGNKLIRHIYDTIEKELQEEGINKINFRHVVNDEFSIFYKGTKESACNFADKIINKISQDGFIWNDKKLLVCISVGIVPLSSTKQKPKDVLVCAYEACASAFASGGNCYKFLSDNDSGEFNMENVAYWLSSIQKALKENRFILYKQAIVPLNDINPHTKYEILIRLQTEEGEIIPPDTFIPIAERYNMIYEIDKWVIKTAFEYYVSLEENDPERKAMYSINISADSFFSNDLINYIFETRAKYNVPAHNFCFELTESCAVRHLDITQKFITELRKAGFSFALDDFGKGFSSFPYLKTLPIDYVKIDGSFIKSIDKDYIDFSMVKTMRDMCHHLGLYTVGEYAESNEIVNILKDIGVDYGQGYAFQKPIPIRDIGSEKL